MVAHKFRFYPTREQEALLARYFGAARWVWNTCLAWRSWYYKVFGESVNGIDFGRELTWLKRFEPYAWLAAVPRMILEQTLRDQDKAFAAFFAKRAKYPRFKRRRTEQAIRFQLNQRRVAGIFRSGEFLKLPGLGSLDIHWSRMTGVPKMVTVRRDACGRYFLSFMAEQDLQPLQRKTNAVGVDLGVKDVVVTSDGRKSGNPKHLRRYLRRLKHQQRVLSRKRKGSGRWHRQRARVARLHARIADTRADFTHKLTTGLIREYQVVAIEDLNVRGMSASAKGTAENPGKRVAQKAGLNRAIRDASFAEIRRQLEYKASWYGRDLLMVDRFAPTSKACSECGALMDAMPLTVREWTCPHCGAEHDRDVNAARNVLMIATGGRPECKARGARTNPSAPTEKVAA